VKKINHVLVVGAGFSSYAGLPLTSEFTESLLDLGDVSQARTKSMVGFLRRFIAQAFDHLPSARAEFWPELEDVFTSIDLSANFGHHLGSRYEPAALRTVRRALIARIITMLRERYSEARVRHDEQWETLERVFSTLDVEDTGFINMNWDTVIEEGLARTHDVSRIVYGCGAKPAKFVGRGVRKRKIEGGRVARVLKLHGSINWLYCDSCREVFWFPPNQARRIASQLITERDWNTIEATEGSSRKYRGASRTCPRCQAVGLSTRLATFSYRKALDFPMFHKTWFAAERLLHDARTWVFIGYSLPPADYEFKYLLKRVQLARTKPPKFVVVTGGSDQRMLDTTYRNYQRFFGRGITRQGKESSFFVDGLEGPAIDRLTGLGVLNPG